mmetsp:Transcript_38817/g.52688  ORF Transcript_38817/g.52688 Transcript_38817/m.52688 type:complete len:139 (-) Transcript_38817:1341-1757(-)
MTNLPSWCKIDACLFFFALVNFLQNASSSITAPFFPLELESKNIDVTWVGFLLSIFSVFYIISSYFTGKILVYTGHQKTLLFGVILVIFFLFGMGSLAYINDKKAFVLVALLSQALGGIGAGFNNTTILALVSSHYKH